MDAASFRDNFTNWLERSQDYLLKSQWSAVAKDYPFLTSDGAQSAFTPFNKKLKFCRLAVVTGGGLYLRERQEPFNVASFEGDFSVRQIPKMIFPDDIEISHEYSNTGYGRQDINVLFPIERLRELEKEELIGELSEQNYSIYDFITQADQVEEKLGQPLAQTLVDDEIDIALFLPVSEIGHQTMAIVQRQVEAKGIATLCIGTNSKAFARFAPPRGILSDCPEGAPLGEPNNAKMHRALLQEGFDFLKEGQPGSVKQSNLSWHDPFA